ncbi:MAG: hypothetical protein ACOC22_03890 [bacterium]
MPIIFFLIGAFIIFVMLVNQLLYYSILFDFDLLILDAYIFFIKISSILIAIILILSFIEKVIDNVYRQNRKKKNNT